MSIDYQKEGSIAIFTINRPEVMNALNPQELYELTKALMDYKEDTSLRAGIITGAGNKAFCTGFDLREEPGDGSLNDKNGGRGDCIFRQYFRF